MSATAHTVYNNGRRISLEGPNNLPDGIRNLQSKGSDLDSLYDMRECQTKTRAVGS